MKLVDLNPKFLPNSEGVRGVGVLLDCPCGRRDEGHELFVPFKVSLDGGRVDPKGWDRVGDTFETLTLTPSIQRVDDCRWHGFITDGEVRTV